MFKLEYQHKRTNTVGQLLKRVDIKIPGGKLMKEEYGSKYFMS